MNIMKTLESHSGSHPGPIFGRGDRVPGKKHRGHFRFNTISALVLLLFVSGVQAKSVSTMPSFSLPSALDDKKMSDEDFKGKVLLITFFTTWCPPCRQEIPTLK